MYLSYPSSGNPDLRLYAEFDIPETAGYLHLNFHGWHGCSKNRSHPENIAVIDKGRKWFFIRPEMRGRGDSGGTPDCSMNELRDAVDAVEFARREFSDRILEPEKVFLSGGSGGGGNVFSILGKFPDYFCRAQADCGIADYAELFRKDKQSRFRDELEGDWIGASPDENPDAYRSRSGITTIGNLLTPLLFFHGENDRLVPAEQSRLLLDAVRQHGKNALASYFELPGCGGNDHWTGLPEALRSFREETAASFMALPSPAVQIPRKGHFTVGGYLETKNYSVELDSPDQVAELDYDLQKNDFILSRPGRIQLKNI